jgi:hypothetical protein
MNPKTWTQDSRRVVWTVSLNDSTLCCLYVQGVLVYEDVSLDDFYSLYNSAVAENLS